MSQDVNLHENCSCKNCQQVSESEKKLHVEISENSRREFFKNAGKLGLGLGIGGGLISPLSAFTLHSEESTHKAISVEKSNVQVTKFSYVWRYWFCRGCGHYQRFSH